jgi:hypothetical protein
LRETAKNRGFAKNVDNVDNVDKTAEQEGKDAGGQGWK